MFAWISVYGFHNKEQAHSFVHNKWKHVLTVPAYSCIWKTSSHQQQEKIPRAKFIEGILD